MKLGIGALSAVATVVVIAACSEDESNKNPSGPDAGGKAGSGSGGTGGSGATGGKGGSGATGGSGTSGGSGGQAATGGSAGAAGTEDAATDTGTDATDALPDGCPLTPIGCTDLGGLVDGSSFNQTTSVLRLVVLSGADDLVSGTAEFPLPVGDCSTPSTVTLPIDIDTGALQVDLTSAGVSTSFWTTCGPAELTIVDRCGSSQVIDVALIYSSEGPVLDLTCAEPDAGPGDAATN